MSSTSPTNSQSFEMQPMPPGSDDSPLPSIRTIRKPIMLISQIAAVILLGIGLLALVAAFGIPALVAAKFIVIPAAICSTIHAYCLQGGISSLAAFALAEMIHIVAKYFSKNI